MKSYSITRRLITAVLLIELISALAVDGVALLYEKHAHFRAFDVLLRGRADSMLGAVQDAEDADDNVMLDGTEINAPRDDVYEVIDAGGRVLGKSPNWNGIGSSFQPERRRRSPDDRDQEAYSNLALHGRAYRLIRLQGLRIVDPGDKGGGVRRYVTVYYGSSVSRVWEAVLHVVGFYAISSLLVLASTGILMAWFMARGLLPLRELARAAEKVTTSSWSFSAPVQARRTRELEPLVVALESVLKGLQQSFEQQRRFVGDAAHELKTSVAVLKSSMQLLGMKPRSSEEYQAGLDRCLLDCERMEAMVAQMLTLARLEESHADQAPATQADLAAGLRQVALELETNAEARGIAIAIHAGAKIIAKVPPDEFKLLCINLLMNALQHSERDSLIAARLEQENGMAVLEILDRGDGIPAQDIPHVFERFFRSDRSRSRETGGTGLGLAISKAILDRCHGDIEIESEVGAGTRVIVHIPLATE